MSESEEALVESARRGDRAASNSAASSATAATASGNACVAKVSRDAQCVAKVSRDAQSSERSGDPRRGECQKLLARTLTSTSK